MGELNMIPNKTHYKLNEICSLLNIKAYVLRFWESEFPEISPEMGANGEKLYSKKDIEAISQIKKLLFENKYTIEKTKMELQLSVKQTKEDHPVKEIEPLNNEMLLKTRQKLNEILSLTSQWKKAFNQT
jgi:DNA-binding transcriptional MerR regulator